MKVNSPLTAFRKHVRETGVIVSSKKLCAILVSSAAVALAISTPAAAVTASATVKANVLKPVQLTGGGTINLGTIVTPSTATYSGTFTVTPSATQTGTFCATSFSCTGTPTAAMFNIQGTNKTDIQLNIPLTVTMTLQGYTGSGAAPILTLTSRNSLFTNNATGNYIMQVPNSGQPGLDFYVGGSLTIDQNTVGGQYQGTFTVTADYL